MLVRDYERASKLAVECTDEGLAAKDKRYVRIGLVIGLSFLASVAMMWRGDEALASAAPGFRTSHPDVHHLLTVLLPAIGIAVFWVGQLFVLDRKREVIALARRLKRESAKEGE